jgi:hypothetical protein
MFYILVLGLATMLSMILRYHSEHFDFGAFADMRCNDGPGGTISNKHCKGDQAVYRISFILVLFFALMTVLSITSEGLHRGYWGVKILLVLSGIIGSFFIPAESFNLHAYSWLARVGSVFFLVLQILILIDFAYQWNDDWVSRAYGQARGSETYEPENRNWLIAILSTAAGLYVFCLVTMVLLYVFYASCAVGVSFITITLISVVTMTVLSVFRDKIVNSEMQGAILPAAIVASYSVFLCWSALESHPDETCRPKIQHSSLNVTFGSILASVTLMWSAFSVTNNAVHLVKGESLEKVGSDEMTTSGNSGADGGPVVRNDLEEQMITDADDDDREDDMPVYSQEQSWTFHLIMVSASMYLAMLLTDWGTAKGPANAGEASMWMKIVAQWLTVLLFSWTLLAPAILKSRDFSF